MRDLASAVDASDWPRALSRALELWRESRAPQLADLIDQLAASCRLPPPPHASELQAWWLSHARTYDPAAVAALVDQIGTRARASDAYWARIAERWPASAIVQAVSRSPRTPVSTNWVERLAVIETWPDDPRVARPLADWLTSHVIHVHPAVFGEVYGAIGDHLARIGDVRVLPRLSAFVHEPDGDRAEQRALVERAKQAIERVPPAPQELLDQLASIPTTRIPTAGLDVDRLWQQVGDRPENLGARTVLADALLVAQDTRGELIALQLAVARDPETAGRDRRVQRIHRLVETEWNRWLGDLAAILVRNGTEFRHGMLEVIRVGHPFTPARAWAAVHGHRELRTVHTVRTHQVPPAEYARFVIGLEHLATLQIDAPAIVDELHRLGARLPVACLEYTPASRAVAPPPVIETFRALAVIAPQLAHVALDARPLVSELRDLAIALPSLLPELRTIEVVAPSRVAARALAEQLAGLPLVTVT